MIKVIVPATSANLGPGFDTLGIALTLYNEYTFKKNDIFVFKGVEKKYQVIENNLLAQSYIKTFEKVNKEVIPAIIQSNTKVPSSRGLGSSACCIIGGILGANAMLGNVLSNEEILDLATSIEGHPDNVAPCLLGGLVSSYQTDKVNSIKYMVSDSLIFKVFIPDFPLRTSVSRRVVPKRISREQAIYNISRAINVPYALKNGDMALLYDVIDDKIHQPYRFPLIAESEKFIEYAKENHFPLAISGAGPTLLMILNQNVEVNVSTAHKWVIMNLMVDKEGARVIYCDE